jgi:hypothetical protein
MQTLKSVQPNEFHYINKIKHIDGPEEPHALCQHWFVESVSIYNVCKSTDVFYFFGRF